MKSPITIRFSYNSLKLVFSHGFSAAICVAYLPFELSIKIFKLL